MDSAIRSLNELRLGSADWYAAPAADKTGVVLEGNVQLQAQGMNRKSFWFNVDHSRLMIYLTFHASFGLTNILTLLCISLWIQMLRLFIVRLYILSMV